MANPGPFPPMGAPMGGPMQPMGGAPMGPMGPMGPGGMPPRQPMRQGTSRLVPVVVSAGLAVGVFCGLLFGLGTGKKTASAEPPKASNGVKATDDTPAPPESVKSSIKGPETTAPKAGSAATASAGSGANAGSAVAGSAAAGSAAGSAEPTIKEPTETKLVVEIKPDTVAQVAKIFVDGKFTASPSVDIALDPGTTKKKVKVLVKAVGYKDVEQEIEVEGESTTLKLELVKAGRSAEPSAGAAGNGGTTVRTGGNTGTGGTTGTGGNSGKGNGGSKGNGGKGKGKGNGLIDI